MTYNPKNISKRLKELKATSKLSPTEMARASKISYNALLKLMSGYNTNPTIRTLIGLSNAFNKTISWFIE